MVESRLSLFGAGEVRCINFSVAAIGEPAPELHVAAVGISGARVRALVDETLEEGCGATGSTGGFSAVLSDVDTAPRLVRLFIPSEAFPIRADGGSAKLIFVRLDAPVTEHAFVLQRQTHRYQGFFTWLLGVLTPVVIAVIGYFGASSAIAADQLNRGTPSRTRILANS